MAQSEEIAVVGARSFFLSDALGDIHPGGRLGLFQADTRFLSRFELTLSGLTPIELAANQAGTDQATFYATNRNLPDIPVGTVIIERHRVLNSHLSEQVSLTNFGMQAARLTVRFDLASDFADVLELRSLPPSRLGQFDIAPPSGCQQAFAYHREGFARKTLLRWSLPGRFTRTSATFDVELKPHESWSCELQVVMSCDAAEQASKDDGLVQAAPGTGQRAEDKGSRPRKEPLIASKPKSMALKEPQPPLDLINERALADLQSLILSSASGDRIIGAGLPYFMALFGRDSLLTSLQTLTADPQLASGVLRSLALRQGKLDDPETDQEPGKIPHEVREGELAQLGGKWHGCYYGTVDATPLFLILLSEYLRRINDEALMEDLWPAAEAALEWIDRWGDVDADGFVEYERRAANGLDNQGWKDSWDAISFADGRLATGPIALCEVQAYVFDAKRRMAWLYEQRGQTDRATALRKEARRLQQQFESAFWMPNERTYALALDGEKRQVDAVASNAAHCLWSGIATPEHAALVVERLTEEDMFSGWGLRTLSTRPARYNPIGYHTGSVWPHDTTLAAAGFLRYGHVGSARQLLDGLLQAATRFPEQRLPELFSGHPRQPHGRPVPYLDANAPQAWAAGATLLAVALIKRISAKERHGRRTGLRANIHGTGHRNRTAAAKA